MQGTLSLGVLLAALVALAGWAGYLLVRLYRACPIARLMPAPQPRAHPAQARPHPAQARAHPADDPAGSEAPSAPQPVA